MNAYIVHLAIMIGIYALLVYSLNLTSGYGGLVVFCHAVFYGVGAYAYTLLRIGGSPLAKDVIASSQLPFIPSVVLAGLAGAVAAFVIGMITLRFRGDLFIFATLAFQMISFVLLYNWTGLARGASGIYAIPRPDLFGYTLHENWHYLLLVGAVNLALLPLLFRVYHSPFGKSLVALRDDESAAESIGISARRHYLAAMTLGGAYAAVAGALFASYATFIDPTSFQLKESLFIVSILLLGGAGSISGPITGVTLMVVLPELLRLIGIPDPVAPNIREILYGLILILLMIFRPRGLAGGYAWD